MADAIPQPGAGPAQPLGPSGQPPFGSSPMSMPLPQKGTEAAGLAQLGVVVKQLERLLPQFGMNSEVGQAVHTALRNLAKHIPQGTISGGMEQSTLQRLLEQAKKMGPQIAQMRGGAGGPPGAGAPPGGAPPSPPPSGA